jgi:hypothetical protein
MNPNGVMAEIRGLLQQCTGPPGYLFGQPWISFGSDRN